MKLIKIPKSEMIKEHKHLLNVLQDGTKKDRLREYLKQKKELAEYKKDKNA
jgi:hypothetical protein